MVKINIKEILKNLNSAIEDTDTLSEKITNSETKVITAITESNSGTTQSEIQGTGSATVQGGESDNLVSGSGTTASG